MKKNEIYTGSVIKYKFPNKGYVKVEGEEELCMVKNTLPGQTVSFQLKKKKPGNHQGNLVEILADSKMEDGKPFCEKFYDCGGCSYQTLSYKTQADFKLKQVQDLLSKVDSNFVLDECVSSPLEYEYRNKMEFSFGDEVKGGALTLGLHKKNSFYDIVPANGCKIVDNDFRIVLSATIDFYKEKNIDFYHKMSHEGVLRHLLIRKAKKTGEMIVCLVTTTQGECYENEWVEKILSLKDDLLGSFAGIIHMENDSLSDVVASDNTKVLYGRDYFYEELFDLRFKITPFSFFQTNSLGAEKLYEVARNYVGDIDGKIVYDLYSGTGTIAQIMAPVAKKVYGVEIVKEAVDAAVANAKENNLDNCEFIAGDVLKTLDNLSELPDMIVLDPPREGIHPKALVKILEYGVNDIVYISCKPTSLARDMEMFIEKGYKPIEGKCVDMFPWTRGIETVVKFSRG